MKENNTRLNDVHGCIIEYSKNNLVFMISEKEAYNKLLISQHDKELAIFDPIEHKPSDDDCWRHMGTV